jgi:hypothetical protein
MTTYLSASDSTVCPHCKNPNYSYALTNSAVLNAQTGSQVTGTVNHCDNCQMNYQAIDQD